jgi:hypothetical protein
MLVEAKRKAIEATGRSAKTFQPGYQDEIHYWHNFLRLLKLFLKKF